MGKSDRLDVLVLAGATPDLRGLRPLLTDHLHGTVDGLHVAAKTVGLGGLAAASGATRRVLQLGPQAVVLIGTCGVYSQQGQYQPLDIIVPDPICFVDPVVREGRAALPRPTPTELRPDPALASGLCGAGARCFRVPAVSPVSTVTQPELAEQVAAWTGAHAESLEAFAVAQACALAEVPFAAALGVTHVVAHGDADREANEARAAQAAAELVSDWVRAGAPGLPRS